MVRPRPVPPYLIAVAEVCCAPQQTSLSIGSYGSFSSDQPAPNALGISASLRSRPNVRTAAIRRGGRVEDGRGSLGHAATLRFPSPLIEPDVRISRIRLSDWLHREAHGTNH